MNWRLITSVLLLFYVGTTSVYSTFTNEFVANIEGGMKVADGLAAKYGFTNGGEIENFPDHYVFHHRATHKRSLRPSMGDHAAIKHEAAVNWIEQQVIRKRVKRDVKWINDPKYRLQWYMNRKTGPNMNVEAAWDMGYTGQGVVVSILDDGIDYTHPDLAKNYDPLASKDINSNDDDPMPWANYDNTNRHGTRCAGEVAMEAGNNICGVGVAYNASIGGVRMLDDEVTDSVEGRSLSTRRDHIDIYSSSWGPEDNGMTVDGPGRLAKKAFKDGIEKGRGGKGSIFVWASGNGGRAKDNCGCDGYTNSIYTVSVSSTSERGEAPWYLEECASTLATTYSSGSPKEKKVITTDLEGRCTDTHTGTSASAPLAAGLCALALQANPDMTWRDMQYVIVMTSRNISLHDSDWFTNGAGYSVSHRYGFGLMDAGAMVQLARNWITLPEQRQCVISLSTDSSRELYGHGKLATFTLDTSSCENGPMYLEHVKSAVDVTFGNRGALTLTLISPSGTHSRLLGRRPRDKRRGGFSSWPFMSTHFWGERAHGEWSLQVENGLPKSISGHFGGWVLTLYGTESLPSSATAAKQPKPLSAKASPVKEEAEDYADHSRMAIPRSLEYFGQCHRECFNGCEGPLANDCYKCMHYRDRVTDECMEHCPEDGYYDPPDLHTKCKVCSPSCLSCAGPSSQDCLSCSAPFFFMESKSECVQVCDDGFYADILSHTCGQCAPECTKCEGSPTYCLHCKEGFLLSIDSTCQASCATNEYLEGSHCKPCNNACYTCRGSQENDCLSCVPGDVLKDWHCIEEWRCTDRYYVRESSDDNGRVCLRCHVSCKNCRGQSSSDCTECEDGILRDGMCVTTCLDGYYRDHGDNCLACSVGCDQCFDEDNCVTCTSEFVLVDGHCEKGCTEGTYENEGHCHDCHTLCSTCFGEGPEKCTSCKSDEHDPRYLFEGACVPFCPEGHYTDEDTLHCEECDETCKTCDGSEINSCLQCYRGFELVNGICNEREDTHCIEACKVCVDGSKDRCGSCVDGKYLHSAECIESCPAGYFTDEDENECLLCNPSCKTCTGTSSQDCTSCNPYQFLFDRSTCDTHCPYSTYADDTDWTCKDCDRTCQSCSGPGSSACETCEGDLFWFNKQCRLVCPSDHYGDIEEQQCMECFPTCRSCNGPLSIHCTVCIDRLELSDGSGNGVGSCEPGNCPSWTYKDGTGICNDCHETCNTCKGPAQADCLTCDYDRFWNTAHRCVEYCDLGYYPDYTNRICRACHLSCKTCVQGGEADCMDCDEKMFFLSKADGVYCVDHCPEGFYELVEGPEGDTSQTCQQCSPQCLDCRSSYSQCISCRDNTFLFKERCIPNCPGGFTEDVESNRCIVEDRVCPLNCRTCDEWGECQVCVDGYSVYYGECMQPNTVCDEGEYQILDSSGNRACRQCFQHCKRCLGHRNDECLKCDENHRLSNGRCRVDCSDQQFLNNDTCLACHPSCETCAGPSPYECRSCPEGTVHDAGGSGKGECRVGCPRGTYLSDTTNQCESCHENCLSCDGNGEDRCLSCRHSYLTWDQRCVTSCPDGTFQYRASESMDDFECRPCHPSCGTCSGHSVMDCTTCHDSMYLLDNTCVLHCGTGYTPGSQAKCQPCHADCKSCFGTREDQCITCTNGKKRLDHRCEEECPEDHYLSFDFGAVCTPCHPRCKTCSDMGPFNCLSCNQGYELENNVCYSRCDPGFYYINDTTTCARCNPTCQECYGATDKHCIACHDGQSLSKVDQKHFTCLSCCKKAQDPDKDKCCTCTDGKKCSSSHTDHTVGKPVGKPVNNPQLNRGAIVFICFLVLAVFGLFFGLLQARSRKMLCWKNSYDSLPTFYNNKGEEPKITLRQNALPSSDEEDYFDDSDD